MGGFFQSNGLPNQSCSMYNPMKDEWILLDQSPRVRYKGYCFLLDEKVFVIGGKTILHDYIPEIDCFSLTSHSWSTLTSILPLVPPDLVPHPGLDITHLNTLLYANHRIYELIPGLESGSQRRVFFYSFPLFTFQPAWRLESIFPFSLNSPVLCAY